MMVRQLVGLGFTVVFIPRKAAIAPTNANQKISSDTDGDFPGQTTAASFITARLRNPTEVRGVNARSWSGGTRRRKNGPALTMLIIRRTLRRPLRMISIAA